MDSSINLLLVRQSECRDNQFRSVKPLESLSSIKATIAAGRSPKIHRV